MKTRYTDSRKCNNYFRDFEQTWRKYITKANVRLFNCWIIYDEFIYYIYIFFLSMWDLYCFCFVPWFPTARRLLRATLRRPTRPAGLFSYLYKLYNSTKKTGAIENRGLIFSQRIIIVPSTVGDHQTGTIHWPDDGTSITRYSIEIQRRAAQNDAR